jgi:hypothetical protein
MGQIIMRNWDLETFVCGSIIHPRNGRYESRSGLSLHQYEVFRTQSGKSYPDLSYPLVSSKSCSFTSPSSLFLVHNSTIIAEHKDRSSLSVSRCHDHELTPSIGYIEFNIHRVQHTPSTAYPEYSIHRVQHTPCTAYTEYSIHQVQHTLGTASTQDCLSFIHSHD